MEAEKGLEGVVVADSEISFIDGNIAGGSLSYRGYSFQDLVKNSNFEETAYLVHVGILPTEAELSKFTKDLKYQRDLPSQIIKNMGQFPKQSDSMDVLRSCISLLPIYGKKKDNFEISVSLISRVSSIISAWNMVRQGKKPIVHSDNNHVYNFLYTLLGKKPDPFHVKVLESWFVMHADHTMNASTFSARVTISTLSDLYSAITSAIGTLKGPLHGGANQKVMEMLFAIKKPENVESYVDSLLARHERIMGIGHRVYKKGDPRAYILKGFVRELGEKTKQKKWYEICDKVEKVSFDRLKLYPNVDFYSAPTLYMLGIPTELFPTLFAAARIVGWTAQVLEQLKDNRLIRPEINYIGKKGLKYMPIGKR